MLYRFMIVIDVGLLIIDFVISLVMGVAQLCTASGRVFYWLLGRKPYREIMFLTGVTIWAVVAAFAYCVSLYWR